MALGIFGIMFGFMSVVSILGLLVLFLVKGEKARRISLYAMAVWGMAIAAFYGLSLPGNKVGGQMLAWGLGLMSAAGIAVCAGAEGEVRRQAASVLMALSIVGGMLKLFSII